MWCFETLISHPSAVAVPPYMKVQKSSIQYAMDLLRGLRGLAATRNIFVHADTMTIL